MNFQASGDAFAILISNMLDTGREEGWLHLAYVGFSNGQAMAFEIDRPKDSLECFNDEAAGLYLGFTNKLAEAVARGKWEESALNAKKFWNQQGEEMMNKIPPETWECWKQSKDAKALNAKLGFDVSDMSFIKLMLKYNEKHQSSYYNAMKGIKSALDKLNFNLAGIIDGYYTQAIIASKAQ